MADFKEVICSCSRCVSMCENRPCWGTPEEIEAIIDAGFGDKLMIDYWEASPNNINMAQPAIIGYEKQRAPFWPRGRCAFLEKGLCTLHDKGLKPLEGRSADCKTHGLSREEYNKSLQTLREFIVNKWKTTQGEQVLYKLQRTI